MKRVPDTEARIRIPDGGRSIDPAGIKFILNPYDEFAVEAALRLREATGQGKVAILSLGGAGTAEVVRTALAMGADEGTVLSTDERPEGLAAATALAQEARKREFDLLLFGMKAIDDDLQAVGPMVAELLELPAVTAVMDVEVQEGRVVAQRAIEGGIEVVEAPIPCVLTITKGTFEPRYASLKGIMAAKKKPIEERPAEVADAGVRVLGLSYPPERKAGRIVGEGPEAVTELVRLLREEAQAL